MVEYLETGFIVYLHDRIIERAGDLKGILNPGTLDACAQRPRQAFYGLEPYSGLFLKTAVLYKSIIQFSPFADGNKRTAYACAGWFLLGNGYLLIPREDWVRFTLRVASEPVPSAEIASWFASNSQRLGWGFTLGLVLGRVLQPFMPLLSRLVQRLE